jgi:hypothetical protein
MTQLRINMLHDPDFRVVATPSIPSALNFYPLSPLLTSGAPDGLLRIRYHGRSDDRAPGAPKSALLPLQAIGRP